MSLRKLLISLIILFTYYTSWCQYKDLNEQAIRKPYNSYSCYLDFSTGIDNHTGLLGLGIMLPVADKVAVRTGLGLGSWGAKFSMGFKLQETQVKGWGVGIGYSYCPGVRGILLTFDTGNGDPNSVEMDLLPVGSVNLTVNHNWTIGERLIIFIEGGYAVMTGGNSYYRINDGSVLTDEEELIMQIMRPGGIIFSFGLQVGL